MAYSSYTRNIVPPTLSNVDVLNRFAKYKLPGDGSFQPEKLEVREQSQKRESPDSRRLFLLAKDRVHYQILKFGDTGYVEPAVADEDISMQ